jgi:glycosyltransferase involved in cell wall biosynthesis
VAGEISEWLGLDLDRIVAISGGIPDIEAMESASADAGRRLAQSDAYVLALGTEEPRKGLPTLIDAFDELAREIPDVTLVLSGPRGWGSDAVDNSIRNSKCGKRIRRLGWVARDQRNSLLKGASVLAYPSLYEGFGYPPLQALAAGVPVVATDVGPLKEVLGTAARLVPRGDTNALAEALHVELTGRSSTTSDSRKAHASAFTWSGLADGLRSVYRRMSQKR